MKKVTFGLAFSALAVATILGSSCNKDDKTQPASTTKTPQDLILGKWNAFAEGADDNRNNMWDASEKNYEPDDFSTMEFKSDGTMIIKTDDEDADSVLVYNYTLNTKGDTLKIKKSNDSVNFTVITLNDSTFLFSTPDGRDKAGKTTTGYYETKK